MVSRFIQDSNLRWIHNLKYFVKWSILSCIIGTIVGIIGACFSKCIVWATAIWTQNHMAVLFMPISGLLIVSLYKIMHEETHKGTNLVIESISADSDITIKTAPLIFISSVLTHLVGGSAGREGAALQIGGSLGNMLGKIFKLDKSDKKIAIMCGMSACFGALFGTPLSAGVFSMEVISVGVMIYSGLIPCLFASFIGAAVSRYMGSPGESWIITEVAPFDIKQAIWIIAFGVCCALVSILFCVVMHKSAEIYEKRCSNAYIRILIGSAIFIALTLIDGTWNYNGGGFPMVEMAMEGNVPYYAFLMKVLFTAVALGAGFKGGEIVPTFCIGACFGGAFAKLFGLDPVVFTACGMMALFVGVTNCPVASILMAFELFGFAGMPYFAIVIAISFTLSGYYGLYHSQKFRLSKIKTEYIDRTAN